MQLDNFNILIKPLVTEKTNVMSEKMEQVAFKVDKRATKDKIKLAFETVFNVKVKKVLIVNTDGKVKRFGKVTGKRASYKKAYICLHPGQDFNLALKS